MRRRKRRRGKRRRKRRRRRVGMRRLGGGRKLPTHPPRVFELAYKNAPADRGI